MARFEGYEVSRGGFQTTQSLPMHVGAVEAPTTPAHHGCLCMQQGVQMQGLHLRGLLVGDTTMNVFEWTSTNGRSVNYFPFFELLFLLA